LPSKNAGNADSALLFCLSRQKLVAGFNEFERNV
jgi:hypothetical protein